MLSCFPLLLKDDKPPCKHDAFGFCCRTVIVLYKCHKPHKYISIVTVFVATLSSHRIIIPPSCSNYAANGANLNGSNRCLQRLVGGSDPRIDIITGRLGGLETK